MPIFSDLKNRHARRIPESRDPRTDCTGEVAGVDDNEGLLRAECPEPRGPKGGASRMGAGAVKHPACRIRRPLPPDQVLVRLVPEEVAALLVHAAADLVVEFHVP